MQAYQTPERIWCHIPEDMAPSEVSIYYHHPRVEEEGWYPAGNVEGWLVPDSYLELDLDGVTYLGLLVRHGGIV